MSTSDAPAPPRQNAVRNTLLIIMALNVVVVAVKIVVGVRTHALSVIGAALESALDVLNNIVGILLVRLASAGPDETHPYGHEKFETLGALTIVGFLSISCFELLRQGVSRALSHESPASPRFLELLLVAATLLVNLFVVAYERRRGRALRSAFLLADAAHTHSDIYVTVAAVASLLLTRMGAGAADPVLAIAVALAIAWNGYQIVRGTVPVLVDERGVDAAQIRELVASVPAVADVRSVRSRASASGSVFAEVTIGVQASTSVAEAHAIADAIEARLASAIGASEVMVHVEPA